MGHEIFFYYNVKLKLDFVARKHIFIYKFKFAIKFFFNS